MNRTYLRRVLRYFYRRKLRNTDFSLITNNCIGGIISHDMHLRFLSPTINLGFDDAEFIRFVANLDEYLRLPVEEVVEKKCDYPVGVIHGSAGMVRIFFMHYKTFEEAVAKWEERKKRVNMDNIYVIMEGNSCDEKMLEDFDKLDFEHKVVLTDGIHENIRSSFPILGDFYGKSYWYGKLLEYPKNGFHRYLECFDYVKFFNTGMIGRRHF